MKTGEAIAENNKLRVLRFIIIVRELCVINWLRRSRFIAFFPSLRVIS